MVGEMEGVGEVCWGFGLGRVCFGPGWDLAGWGQTGLEDCLELKGQMDYWGFQASKDQKGFEDPVDQEWTDPPCCLAQELGLGSGRLVDQQQVE